MNKKLIGYLSVIVILVFIGYMVYDSVHTEKAGEKVVTSNVIPLEAGWKISAELEIKTGSLKAVAASPDGLILVGGGSFVSCYDSTLKNVWELVAPAPVTSIACNGDTIFASTMDQILVISKDGKMLNEWGPYEKNSIITSVSAFGSYVGFADAGNRIIYILDKGGEVKKMVGQGDNQFILPSAYFDIAMNQGNSFFVANTGHRRIEKRDMSGKMVSMFGEAGLSPDAFCGCCNPAHFALIPGGFITAEKGVNRIKILDPDGKFVEFVSAKNDFAPSIPLDVASADGKTIYAANPDDSKLYVFKRK